jgi:hypothetical protein
MGGAMGRAWIALALLAAAGSAGASDGAPTIYKCVKDGGVVFSPTPCGANATQVDTSRALMRGDSPNVQGVSDAAAVASIDGDCRSRSRAITNRYAADYAGLNQEIARLNAELSISANNFAGATRDNGIRAQLAGIGQRRSDLMRGEREEQAALARQCDDARREEQKRQAERDAKSSGGEEAGS